MHIHVQGVDFFYRESQVELRQHIDSLADGNVCQSLNLYTKII